MPEEKFGVENIKSVIGFGLSVSQTISKAIEDQKFNWQDSFSFIPLLPKIPGVIKSAVAIGDEYTDLSEAEAAEIKEFVKEKIDCANEDVEKLIQDALVLAIDLAEIIEDVEALIADIKALK